MQFVSDANTRSSTAACAACFAGEIACVYTSNVERSEECRSSSCITLNSVPTLRRRVEYVCRNVPTELFVNSSSERDGTSVPAQNRLAPNRLPATVASACKNPIVWFVVTADLFPFAECLQDGWMNGHGLLG